MVLVQIKTKIELYYNTLPLKKAEQLITQMGSEFGSNWLKAIALSFLSEPNIDLIRSLIENNEDFIEIQKNPQELLNLVNEQPLFIDLIDTNQIVSSYILFIKGNGIFTNIGDFSFFEKIYWGLGDSYHQEFINFLNNNLRYCVFLYLLGLPEKLMEEVASYQNDINILLNEIEKSFKSFNQQVPALFVKDNNAIIEQILMGEEIFIKEVKSENIMEIIQALSKATLYQIKNYENNIIKLSELIDKNLLKNRLNELIPKLIELDNYCNLLVLLKWDKGLIKTNNIIQLAILHHSFKVLSTLLEEKIIDVDMLHEYIYKQALDIGDPTFFINFIEKLELNLTDSSILNLNNSSKIQKICLKANNNIKNTFDLIIWDWIHQKLAIDHFKVGKHSFSYHYPELYKHLCELERYDLFYNIEDFKDYIRNNYKEGQEKKYLENVVSIVLLKLKNIHKILEEDIDLGINSQTYQPLNDSDLAVLKGYQEKLKLTVNNLIKMMSNFKKLTLEELFSTNSKITSIPNLKGFYLGELKIGGLENYTGHSKEISEILKPFGFLLNPDIRKEIDHYIVFQENNNLQLTIVESKNYQKILTRKDSRIMDIKNQKQRFDDTIVFVRKLLEKDNCSVNVHSSIFLNKGLTLKAKNALINDKFIANYDNADGVIFNFENLNEVVIEEFDKFCEILNSKKVNSILNWDIYHDRLMGIARGISMIEEDSEDILTNNNQASPTVLDIFKQCGKISQQKLKNKDISRDLGRQLFIKFSIIVKNRGHIK